VVRDTGRMRVEGVKEPAENAKEREATRVWKDFKVSFSLARLGYVDLSPLEWEEGANALCLSLLTFVSRPRCVSTFVGLKDADGLVTTLRLTLHLARRGCRTAGMSFWNELSR